jgi:hypothetical protein
MGESSLAIIADRFDGGERATASRTPDRSNMMGG